MTENRGIERKTIIQIFPDWYVGNGIFSYLANNAVPWQAENFTTELDNLYIGRSGYKYISTILVVGSFFIVLGIVGAVEIGTVEPATYIFIPISIMACSIGVLGFKFLDWVES